MLVPEIASIPVPDMARTHYASTGHRIPYAMSVPHTIRYVRQAYYAMVAPDMASIRYGSSGLDLRRRRVPPTLLPCR
eukprot:1947691-Rhodomonas_salina.1